MKNINQIKIYIYICSFLINFNEYLSSYLPSGVNEFNKYIYLDRLKTYTFQNLQEKCSLSNGPYCYFTEMKYIDINENENNDLKNSIIPNEESLDFKKEWNSLLSRLKDTGIYINFLDLFSNIEEYNKYMLSKSDPEQIPPPVNLQLTLTFESYNDITIKGDTYAYQSKKIYFPSEYITLEILGKLRLRYDRNEKYKNYKGYPSKTYGIIESNNLNIKFGNYLFKCQQLYVRKHEENIVQINIDGYLGSEKVFSIQKDLNNVDNYKWQRIILPDKLINRIVLPKGIQIDNLIFFIQSKQIYEISSLINANKKNAENKLIDDKDIF